MSRHFPLRSVALAFTSVVALGGTALWLDVSPSTAASTSTTSSERAKALVKASLVELSRSRVFKTVTTSPSLNEIAVVEPRAHAEASTSHLDGPAGRGVVQAIVTKGREYVEGTKRGWEDLFSLEHASKAQLATAGSLAGHWYLEPARSGTSVSGFGPTLGGIGHVFCAGASCNLSGVQMVGASATRTVIAVPSFGGDLVLKQPGAPVPIELFGTGTRAGLQMRIAYPSAAPTIVAPSGAQAAPASLSS